MRRVIRKEILIGAAIAFAVLSLAAAVVYFTLAHPRHVQAGDAESRLALKQQELESLLPENLKVLRDQARQYRDTLSDYVELSGQQGDVLIALKVLAGKRNLTDFRSTEKTVISSSSSKMDSIVERQIRIDITGDFKGFAGFLRDLENNKPVVFVNEFNVSPESKNDSKAKVIAAIDFVVLREKAGLK